MTESKTTYDIIDAMKRALLNPLLIYYNIFGIGLPQRCFINYSSTIYKTLFPVFDNMICYESYEDDLDNILKKNGITLYNVAKESVPKRRIAKFIYVLGVLEDDIKELHRKICFEHVHDEVIQDLIVNYRRLFEHIGILPSTIATDIESVMIMIMPEDIRKFSEIYARLINHYMKSLMHADKVKDEEQEESHMRNKNHSELDDNYETLVIKDKSSGDTEIHTVKKDKIKVNRSRQQKIKKELTDNVNAFDKAAGCNLKKPKKTLSESHQYYQHVENVRYILAKLLCILNEVNIDNYVIYDSLFGTELVKLKINKRFKKKSRWFDGIEYYPEDMRFKIKFLSYMLSYVVENISKYAEVCYYVNNDSDFNEWNAKTGYINNVSSHMFDLITNVLNFDDYSNELMYFVEMELWLTCNMDEQKKYSKKIENIHNQTWVLSNRLKMFSNAEHDISMDTLLKLSYMVTINDPKIKGRISFNEGYRFSDKYETEDMVRELGHSIRKRKDRYCLSRIFEFFVKSDPLIYSRFEEANEDMDLLTGLIAMKYYAFLTNDNRIMRRVNKLI